MLVARLRISCRDCSWGILRIRKQFDKRARGYLDIHNPGRRLSLPLKAEGLRETELVAVEVQRSLQARHAKREVSDSRNHMSCSFLVGAGLAPPPLYWRDSVRV